MIGYKYQRVIYCIIMVETVKNNSIYDENIYITGNEVYDNYFRELRKWLATAKEREQTFINEYLSTAQTLQTNTTTEVNNNGI